MPMSLDLDKTKRALVSAGEEVSGYEVDPGKKLLRDPALSFWFVGALWNKRYDQSSRFLADGIWEYGYSEAYFRHVRRMKIGDRIAIKRTSNVRDSLPFDINGALASRMRIEAIGTVTSNLGNGKRVNVDWRLHQPRDWFFYTYVAPVVEAKLDDDFARHLILFTFTDAEQDYKFWINQPHWAKKYMGAELAD